MSKHRYFKEQLKGATNGQDYLERLQRYLTWQQKRSTKTPSETLHAGVATNVYLPHQGERERARRRKQNALYKETKCLI